MTQLRWIFVVAIAAQSLCTSVRAEQLQRLPLESPQANVANTTAVTHRVAVTSNVTQSGPPSEIFASYEQQLLTHAPDADQTEVVYSLLDLEGIATSSNPALAESQSRIEAAKGRALQVSLPPNPTVGYLGNEIGNEGSAGQHGAYWSRQFVRGDKLELNRAIACREVHRLQQEYHVLRERLLTDVRTNFYEIVFLQQRTGLLKRILETNKQAANIATQLFDAGENTKSDVLLLELEAEQTATDLVAINAARRAKWRGLTRILGQPGLEEGELSQPEQDIEIEWVEAVELIQHSPQLAAIHAEVSRNRAAVRRAIAEPIPNLNAQVSWQYDYSTNDSFTGVQLGMRIPKFDQNQGAIYEANANVRAAMQKHERVRMAIERDLAEKFGAYEQAKKQLQRIDKVIVPKAEEVVRIALGSYKAGEASLADILNAQRSLLRSLVRQLDARRQLRLSYVAMQGFLLSDGLSAG